MNLPVGCKQGKNGEISCKIGNIKQKYNVRKDRKYWFEYHCYESNESCDAKLWHHSHQKVKVLSLSEPGYGKNKLERMKEGQPAVFKVEFDDDLKYDVYEDELMTSKRSFSRPNPPKMIF